MPREPIVESVEQVTLEYVDLDTLMKWPTNPKEHDLGAIAASMLRFGMRDPIAVNLRNTEIEEGHGRRDTLAAMKSQGRPAPRYVQVTDDGKWLVPVLWFDDDDLTQHGYALAHNRAHDLGGGYDQQKLYDALREQAAHGQLIGTGYEGGDMESLRRKIEAAAGVGAPDQTAQLRSEFQILITCTDESQQAALLEQFTSEGLQCRALVS